jgi:hypothetical protein
LDIVKTYFDIKDDDREFIILTRQLKSEIMLHI